MGMGFPFGSARRCRDTWFVRDNSAPVPDLPVGDPNPVKFEIRRIDVYGKYIVAEVRWPDATNFDGVKIAIYQATPAELITAKRLDPHFSENIGPLVPIARFEPTERGWLLATTLAVIMNAP